MGRDKRRFKRYPLSGQAVFRTTAAVESKAQPVNVGLGGILLCSGVAPIEGTELWVHFSVIGTPKKFITPGRVVRSDQEKTVAIKFLEEPAGLNEVLASLEK